LWNLVMSTWDRTSRMTLKQQLILIGSIILPAGSLILIFSQSGQQIIQRLMKVRTLRTFGRIKITNTEIDKHLYERHER
jgi:hypothetical protein